MVDLYYIILRKSTSPSISGPGVVQNTNITYRTKKQNRSTSRC